MTIRKLAKLIAEREGKKRQVDIAQISEILDVLSDLSYEDLCKKVVGDSDIWILLLINGEKRAKRKGKK